jgi:hypothetical protein
VIYREPRIVKVFHRRMFIRHRQVIHVCDKPLDMPKLLAFSLAALCIGMILDRVFDRIKPNRERLTHWVAQESRHGMSHHRKDSNS